MSKEIVAVRLPESDTITNNEVVARYDGVAVAELLRAGVEIALESGRTDPEFREKVEAGHATARRILEDVDGADALRDVYARPLPTLED